MQVRLAITGLISGILIAGNALAYQPQVNAQQAYLYHPGSDSVLFKQGEKDAISPASLTKLMTLYLLFTALENGDVTLDSELPISEKAWRKGGSKMFLEVGKLAKVDDLIRGIAISSGNDACIVVSEFLGGTEEGFVGMMNSKAADLGMTNTTFTNASGWPDPLQTSTVEDLTKLAAAIIHDFPEYYHYFSETVFTYNGIKQHNRNGLLKANVGVDGMKTGHTEEAGYHLIASGKQDGERLISVVIGTDGFAAREGESLKLLRYGFTQYRNLPLWEGWQAVGQANVWLGQSPNVPLVAAESVAAYLPRNMGKPKMVKITYQQPLVAPVTSGQTVGKMEVELNGKLYSVPLLAGADVPKADAMGSFMQKLFYRVGL